jgi:hypothetical protein
MGLFKIKPELDELDLDELSKVSMEVYEADGQDYASAGAAIHDLLIDGRLTREMRREVGRVALKQLYHERRIKAIYHVYELERSQESYLEEVRGRQRNERDEALNTATILRGLFRMNPA